MVRNQALAIMIFAASTLLCAQDPNPTQQLDALQPEPGMPTAIFRIQVVSRSTAAVNYLHRGGSTKINFEGTSLMTPGRGVATVESERGVIRVSAEFQNFVAPSSFGPEYLTYVLWAISPDGRPVNLGELTLNNYGNGSKSAIKTTSEIQTFGMIVTAEPYYAVTQPSDVVVMENIVRKDTRGVIETVDAKYELLPRGMYTAEGKASGFVPIHVDKKNPFELYEAENAVMLARLAGAPQYAAESYQKALDSLAWANRNQNQKPGQKPTITMAREAVLRAEDSRVIAIRAEREEALTQERESSLNRENAANVKADEETRQRIVADRDRAAAEIARAEAQTATLDAQRERAQAEMAKQEADRARQEAVDQQQKLSAQADQARTEAQVATEDAQRERQAAEAAKLEALDQQQKLSAQADQARAAAAHAQQEQADLRQKLILQFNQILETRESARGLIVNMSDVLFDTAKFTLKPGAREKLAKVSGIILAHPGLKIAVEGHTDDVGGDEYNMKLSENRANAVETYLVSQGLNSGSVTAQGFGKTQPVADNGTAAGRQRNRRVEMVVSGEMLGSPVATPTAASLQ
jgi:outer membrane protein OmpA-like peptidoglycan-associated protein